MARVKRISRTRQIVAATVKQSHRAVARAVAAGVETMHRLVPVDHGDLDSTVEGTDDGGGHGKIEVGGQSKISDKIVDYGADVEFGTVHRTKSDTYSIPAQPFFRPGLDAARTELRENMKIREK